MYVAADHRHTGNVQFEKFSADCSQRDDERYVGQQAEDVATVRLETAPQHGRVACNNAASVMQPGVDHIIQVQVQFHYLV